LINSPAEDFFEQGAEGKTVGGGTTV
jgi:hypothetical protein